jgi:hypothetical protein
VRGAVERWNQTLDTFEETLEGYLALSVAAHDPGSDAPPTPPAFSPPEDLPPLPERLRVRAVELAYRARLIEAELGRARDDTAAQLTAVNRPNAVYGTEREPARLLDTMG